MDTKALRQKILDLAIRGKLVPQDPDDEPASVLLEKIREQKQQMFKEGKLKKKDIKNDSIIFKGEDNLHYEKFQDGTMKCIEDEIPFELPEGWAWCHYSDVIELYSGQDLTSDRYNDTGEGVPYITGASNLEHGKVIINRWTITPTTHATIGDLLLTVKGSGVGKMAFCDIIDAHIARQIMALRCTSAITPQYLYIAISAMLSNITAQANGIIPGIRREIVLGAYLPLPPRSEQEKICKIADNTLHIVDDIDTNKDDLKKIIQITKSKILDLAIRGQLVPQNLDDEPASVLLERIGAEKEELIKQGKIKRDKKESIIFKGEDNSYYETIGKNTVCIDEEIPFDIPDRWTWCRLQSISSILTDGTHKTPEYSDSGYMFLSSRNVTSGKIDWENVMYIPEYLHEELYGRLAPAKDDILLAKNGTTGVAAIVDHEEVFDIYVSLALIRIINNMIFPEYILHTIGSSYIQNYFNSSLKGIGVPNLHLEHIRKTLIPIPTYTEQKLIAEKIKHILFKIDDISNALL